jgi:hypothetical protein
MSGSLIEVMGSAALTGPSQDELDLLLRAGVDIIALAMPLGMQVSCGTLGSDGRFDPDPHGERWFAFDERAAHDVVFWHWGSRQLCSWSGRAFALGQDAIDDPSTYSFDCNLNIFADPLQWLLAKRDGIVVLPEKWPLAFDRLRNVPRIAITEGLLPLYQRHMKPSQVPELFVLPQLRCAA